MSRRSVQFFDHTGSIFPSNTWPVVGGLMRRFRGARQLASYVYDRAPLEKLLNEALSDRLIGDAKYRLNIPAFEGHHSEVYIYKTPHHPDFKLDAKEKMVTAALATAAAPTYFSSLQKDDGYVMVDGGVWANNPAMIALVDALSCFDVKRHRVSVLSIGCGAEPYVVTQKLMGGGMWHWRKVMGVAMHLQSLNALGQVRLLVGAERVLRLEPPQFSPAIAMDDFGRASALLPAAAASVVHQSAQQLADQFLYAKADQYQPQQQRKSALLQHD